MKRHCPESLSSICFGEDLLATFDCAGVMVLTSPLPLAIRRGSYNLLRVKTTPYSDVKPLVANLLLGAANLKDKGRLDLIDLETRRTMPKVSI